MGAASSRERATVHFKKALEEEKHRDEAWEGLAQTHRELWRSGKAAFEEVLESLDHGLEVNRGLEGLHMIRAYALDQHAYRIYWHQGEWRQAYTSWEEAEKSASEAVSLWPHGGEEYGMRAAVRGAWGDALRDRGRERAGEVLRKAVEDGDEAVKRSPESPDVYKHRAVARWMLGEWKASRGEDPSADYEAAIEDFGGALAKNPNLWQVHANRRLLFETMGQLEKALAEYESAFELGHDPRVKALIDRVRSALGEGVD